MRGEQDGQSERAEATRHERIPGVANTVSSGGHDQRGLGGFSPRIPPGPGREWVLVPGYGSTASQGDVLSSSGVGAKFAGRSTRDWEPDSVFVPVTMMTGGSAGSTEV
jgi:hypothetical protein